VGEGMGGWVERNKYVYVDMFTLFILTRSYVYGVISM
jgi:hypothetical protein